MVENLAKFGLQVDSRDASSGAVASVSCRFCLRLVVEPNQSLWRRVLCVAKDETSVDVIRRRFS
jgi:hypothetical protein